RRSNLDYGTGDNPGFRSPGITKEFTSRFWRWRSGRDYDSSSSRSDRRSNGFLWRVSAPFLGERGWPDSEREGQRHNGVAATGRSPTHLCRIISQYSVFPPLHAVRRTKAENHTRHERGPKRG